MKKKLIAATAAAAVAAVNATAVFANYGYDANDNNYGYDTTTTTANYGYTDNSPTDNYYWYEDTSSIDPTQDHPSTITLETGEIKDKKFSADMKIDANSLITAMDITVTYDSDVFKLTSDSVNEEAGGTGVGSKLSDGVYEYVYTNYMGSDWEESYFTLDFEIIDASAKSSVLYITVNSMLDNTNTEMTCVADGTVVQIEGAVPVDASADESMFSELRVEKSDKPIGYDSLGLENVKSVTFEDGELASADENGISTLAEGITNMTVEYDDGTFGYFRLVINSEPILTEADSSVDSAAETAATVQTAGAVSKKETKNADGVKKMIIFVVVVLAVAAIAVEYFMIVGNPFAGLAEKRKEKPKREAVDDDDFFPETSDDDERETEYYQESDDDDSPETDSEENNDDGENDTDNSDEDENEDSDELDDSEETDE